MSTGLIVALSLIAGIFIGITVTLCTLIVLSIGRKSEK